MRRTTTQALRSSEPAAGSYEITSPHRGGRTGTVTLAILIMMLGLMVGALCVSQSLGLLPQTVLDSSGKSSLVLEGVQAIFAAMAGLLLARRAGSHGGGRRAYLWVGAGPVALVLLFTVVPTMDGFPWWRVPLDVIVVAAGVTLGGWLRIRHDHR
jgi:hypothetical protein